jgi:hypothetical protein
MARPRDDQGIADYPDRIAPFTEEGIPEVVGGVLANVDPQRFANDLLNPNLVGGVLGQVFQSGTTLDQLLARAAQEIVDKLKSLGLGGVFGAPNPAQVIGGALGGLFAWVHP